MKEKIIFLLLVMMSLASCDVIYFDKMPGELLATIPHKFVGKYDVYHHRLLNGNDTVERDDSVCTLTKTSINFRNGEIPRLNLNDTCTFSEYKGFYFISLRQPSDYWQCFILQETKNGFIGTVVWLSSDSIVSANDQNAISELKKYFPELQVIKIKNSDGDEVEEFYSIMQEDQIIAFFKAQVKKPDYSEFVKR